MKRTAILGIIALVSMTAWLMPAFIAYASNTTLAEYIVTIRITNNGTAAANVFVPFSLNTTALQDSDYISDNCLNTSMLTNGGADTGYMPARSGNLTWNLYVPSIGQNDNLDYRLYLGGANDMDGKARYFPDDAGMSANDSATLELGDNFTIEQKGWVDTTQIGANLTSKLDAIRTWVSATGNITAALEGPVSPISHNDPDTAWSDEPNAYDNNTGTYSSTSVVGQAWGSFLELNTNNINTDRLRYMVTRQDGDILEVDIDAYYSSSWNNVFQGAADWGNWETKTLGSTENVTAMRIRFYCGTGTTKWARIYEADFNDLGLTFNEIVATGVSSGEHTIESGVATEALECDGTSTFVNTGNSSILNPNVMTIELWMKADNANVGSYRGLVMRETWDSSYQLYVDGTSIKWLVKNDSDNTTTASATGANQGNTWQYIVATFNGTGSDNLNLYKDGNLLASANLTGVVKTSSGNTTIGRSTLVDSYWEGAIDEVRIYNRSFYAGEMAFNYNGGDGRQDPYSQTGLVGWWSFDEGTGSQVEDETSNNNDGIITGASWGDGKIYSQFYISVDGAEQDTDRVSSVTDNSENWTYYQNMGGYWEYTRVEINGVLQQHIIWENVANHFVDQSGNGHHAAPNYRTTSSNADVSAAVISFEPVSESDASGWSLSTASTMITTAPTQPGDLYSELTYGSNIPVVGMVNEAIDAAGVPRSYVWFPLAALFICVVGFAIGHFSLLAQLITMSLMFFIVAGLIWSPWLGLLFIIPGATLIVAKQQLGYA